MATKVYLGYPPPNVRTWIENKYKKTIITFDDESTEEYDWSEEVAQNTLIDAGILDGGALEWTKNPVSIRFGTTVTSVGYGAFQHCPNLTSVSMPNVTTICESAFSDCPNLTSVSTPSADQVSGYAFVGISTSVEFENQTTSKISEWFGNWVFGDGWGPVTVTCSDGSVHAEWDDSEHIWNVGIVITPAQQ